MPQSTPPTVALSIACVPMKIDCLVVNEQIANDPDVKIAPLSQPNYTFLRMDNQTIQSDVIPFTDLHYTSPIEKNRRLTDLGTGDRRMNRQGVYVSWTMPRAYRMGVSGTDAASSAASRAQRGLPPIVNSDGTENTDGLDFKAPDFRPAPNRWMIVRYVDKSSLQLPTKLSDQDVDKLLLTAWILDSDRLSPIDDIPLERDGRIVDLQTDYSPFVMAQRDNSTENIEQQAEVFIGYRTPLDQWQEDTTRSAVPLTLLNSSNPLFADFQPHNSNVFSMIDEMTYQDTTGIQKIMSATASYYVIGWHSDTTNNPFYLSKDVGINLQTRMGYLAMVMKNGVVADGSTWPQAETSSDTLCHGAMYNVNWTAQEVVADKTAQSAAKLLNAKNPIAVGANSMDALFAYIKSHVEDTTGPLKELEQDVIKIQSLLVAQDDGIDSNMQAMDELETHAYHNTDGGQLWHLGGDPTTPNFTPNSGQGDDLDKLNKTQSALDSNLRTQSRLSWDVFSIWWKYISGAIPNQPNDIRQAKFNVGDLVKRWTNLDMTNKVLQKDLEGNSLYTTAKRGTRPMFSQRRDPTLLIGGVRAGWPDDYLDPLQIRTHIQTVKASDIVSGSSDPASWSGLSALTAQIVSKFSPNQKGLQAAITNLLLEFNLLSAQPTINTSNCVLPLYHDQIGSDTDWRDQWSGQAWFPLFLEWEADYYHIPYDSFSLQARDSDHSAQVIRWGIKDGVDLGKDSKILQDLRVLSGRVLLLPQTSSSLANTVTQVLTNMAGKTGLQDAEIKFLKDKKNYYQLPFLTSTLNGLNSHLTTRMGGTHIKPTQRPRGEKVTANDAAVSASIPIGTTNEILANVVGQETALTPYGDSVQFLTDKVPPFKPATHGQLRFKEINIIDKFGRAICALDPTPEQQGTLHIAPCLSDLYTCQPLRSGSSNPLQGPQTPLSPILLPPQTPGLGLQDPTLSIPNTVTHDLLPPQCEYAQLPPAINQPARINMAFCKPDPSTAPPSSPNSSPSNPTKWMPINEWETPAYGWIVMNYADYGMQFFQSDGTFYRELRFGGPSGFVESPAWTPFARPASSTQSDSSRSQLDLVIDALTDSGNAGYMQAFYNMITFAFGEMQPTDSSYAQFVNSIIGRPLALVNIGTSLELAAEPLKNESNIEGPPQPWTLLEPPPQPPSNIPKSGVAGDPKLNKPPQPPPQQQYSFPVQVGDKQRNFDGLVGYWKPLVAKATDSVTPKAPVAASPAPLTTQFDYTKLYTFWPDTKTSTQVASITPGDLSLKPFFVAPDRRDNTGVGTWLSISPEDQRLRRNSQLNVVSAIIDPFTAVHTFSGTLPTVSVTLPRWAVESALNKMTAFFHMGPVLVTADVPALSSDKVLRLDYDLKDADLAGKVGMPALKVGQWRWLQPYPPGSTSSTTPAVSTNAPADSGTHVAAATRSNGPASSSLETPPSTPPSPALPPPPTPTFESPNYMPLGLLSVDSRPRFEPPPYLALEGFLQLSAPIMSGQAQSGQTQPEPVQPVQT